MFSVRIHLPAQPGHTVYECSGYSVKPDGDAKLITMVHGDTAVPVRVPNGGIAYVMGDSGKTVEIIRTLREPATMKGAR